MLAQALVFLIQAVFTFFVLAFLGRFYLQVARAPFRNPFSQFLIALTNFAVLPLRRVIPGWGGLDLASLTAAWLAELVMLGLVLLINTGGMEMGLGGLVPVLLVWSLLKLLDLSLTLLFAALIVQAVLSWVNPYTPLAPVLGPLTEPFLRPVRKVLPLIGGVDLSPLVVILAIQLIQMVPLRWLEMVLLGAVAG